METSQLKRAEIGKTLDALESRMFASAFGANMRARPMTIDALMDSPEHNLAALPSSSRATDLKESVFVSLAPDVDRRRCISSDRRQLRLVLQLDALRLQHTRCKLQ
uniref:Uncharacterized protein n=1 Tax=Peronospora matthiolae TaxID=2874970 RepID=A0AAV1TL04_9STRA